MTQANIEPEPAQQAAPAEKPKHKKDYLFGDTVYQVLKWLDLTALPAFSALIIGLGNIWSWPWAQSVSATVSVVAVFIGALIGLSQIKANASQSR